MRNANTAGGCAASAASSCAANLNGADFGGIFGTWRRSLRFFCLCWSSSRRSTCSSLRLSFEKRFPCRVVRGWTRRALAGHSRQHRKAAALRGPDSVILQGGADLYIIGTNNPTTPPHPS